MTEKWEEKLSCAFVCSRCNKELKSDENRILSIYDHNPICLSCKKDEEKKPDYETVSRKMIGNCMAETELMYSDPGGYCYFHFYPFKC